MLKQANVTKGQNIEHKHGRGQGCIGRLCVGESCENLTVPPQAPIGNAH